MADFVASGRLVELVIALTLLEFVALAIWHRRTGRGPRPRALALSLAGGLCLMVALRAAIADAAWPWIVAPVAAAGIVHALDLRARWPR